MKYITMPLSNIFCQICDANIDHSTSINIFGTTFPRHGELLVNFISKVLRLTTNVLQGPYICLHCYNLFEMLEQAQRTVSNIRCEISNVYRATEKRKCIKQSTNNDVKPSLTSITLDKKKFIVDGEKLRAGSNCEMFQAELTVQQEYARDNILSPNINVPSTDDAINNEIVLETKKHIKIKATVYNDIDNMKLRDHDTHKDAKENTASENDVICTSTALSNNAIVYNINAPPAVVHALEMRAVEGKLISVVDSEKNEPKDCLKPDIFSENRLQVENVNYKWNEINENIQVKEDSGNTAVANIDKRKVPVSPDKIFKEDSKLLKYSCPTCNKRWKTAAELRTHTKTHSTLRPYMCEKCGQAYKHKHALEIHVGMHNGINPFQCNFCQKCFTQKGALMRHLPMHTGETPYQCELCGKRFIHHTSYNMHRLSHSGKKSYKCHMCDLSLLSTSHLKRHMRVHTGEKPYSCTVCGKRFAERYNLLAHRKVHDALDNKTIKAKETQYQCNCCNLLFEQMQSLNEHIKQHADPNNESDLEKSNDMIIQVETEAGDLAEKIGSEHSILQQTWLQMNRPKLDLTDNQARFVLLQNPLPEIDENSFAVTFSDQKVSLESTNYNTNLQVIIESSNAALLSNNLAPIDKMHM